LSVSRPIEDEVLKACVTETNEQLAGLQPLHQLGEVGERPGQPVDLVDDDHVHAAGIDVGEETLQGRALQRAAGDATVVVAGGQHLPALVALARDVGGAGLVLRIERVEVLVETLVRGLPRVDRAADHGFAHGAAFPLSPKNRGPDQCAPVISRAMEESDRQVSPFQRSQSR
jgi:hypothetical protein